MDFEQLLLSLRPLSDLLEQDPNVISIEWDLEPDEAPRVVITVHDPDVFRLPGDVPGAEQLTALAEVSDLDAAIRIVAGDPIEEMSVRSSVASDQEFAEALALVANDPSVPAPKARLLGGVACFNFSFVKRAKWLEIGTVGVVVARASNSTAGPKPTSCNTKQSIISCHHVLAHKRGNQRGQVGDLVGVVDDKRGRHLIAKLDCAPTLGDPRVNVDYAAAGVTKVPSGLQIVQNEVLGLGKVKGVRKPKLAGRYGETVRKYGAITGLTEGYLSGVGNFRTDGGDRVYGAIAVTPTNKVFGEGGDSGSLVVGQDNLAVGMYSWGERKASSPRGKKGYFWPIIDMGGTARATTITLKI